MALGLGDYEGGELVMRLGDRDLHFKEPAGTAIVYPASSIHRVEPVTAGERIVGITWLQSLVRDAAEREVLFKLEEIRSLALGATTSDLARKVELEIGHVRTMLMRKWMEV